MISSQTSPPSSSVASPRTLGLPDLAFVGKAGSGKSTAAELLAELGYLHLSFMTPLKRFAAELWGADVDRGALIDLGAAVREIDSNTLVDSLLKRKAFVGGSMGYIGPTGPFVVDDCRFEPEWFALKAEGFAIVRLNANPGLRADRLKAKGRAMPWPTDTTETALDQLTADHTIENTGTKDDLYDELVNVVLQERKRR